MGNIVEKIGAMVARLGTKLANNYGGTASNRYVVLHAPAGSNNERLDPNCAMSLNEFAQVLGGVAFTMIYSGSLNDYNNPGGKYCIPNGNPVSNIPDTGRTWFVFVIGQRGLCLYQIAFSAVGDHIYERSCNNDSDPTNWNPWHKIAFT